MSKIIDQYNSRGGRFVHVIHDGERKGAERQLAKLNAALESANDAIAMFDVGGDVGEPLIEYVNPAFLRMFGYEMAEVIGKSPDCLSSRDGKGSLAEELRRELRAHESFRKWSITAAPVVSSWPSGI